MSIFQPQNKNARPLQNGAFRDGSLGRTFLRAMGASVLPRYTPIGPIQSSGAGEYFLNGVALASMRGLGAGVASMIPGDCWDVSGFKDCHAQWFAQAQKDCQGGEVSNFNGDMDACTDVYADQYAQQNCVPKYCPQTIAQKQSGGLSAAQVIAIQKACNVALAANGYKLIGVDGKLGPATCGAASFLLQNYNVPIYKDYHLELYCTTWTNPTKVGSNVPMQTTVIPEVGSGPLTIPQWGKPDPTMAATQQSINRNLDASGYFPIPVTGVLDAATCGAMQWMKQNMGQDMLSSSGSNCQSFTPPKKKPASQSPATAPPGSGPPAVAPRPPVPPSKAPLSTASMLIGGGILAVAGLGYYYAKKKGMV